jgi:transcriptional regulator with XRE-family HTH domain
MTQKDIAEALGIYQYWISRIECGRTNDPGVNMIAMIATALGVNISDFMT